MTVFHPPLPFHRPHLPRTPRPRALSGPRPRPARRPAPGRALAGDLALPLGAVASALLATALLLTGRAAPAPITLGAFALLTLLVSALARPLVVPAVALVSWMFYDGFVVNRSADLTFGPSDRTALLVLLLVGSVGAGYAAVARAVRRYGTSGG
ncbi:DUF4118 domain-containing protein [Streptomyces sp. NPDC020742]|uniref:DUF4118 domain-containing protein n=1 Tax=Streptomyces sp. NPDC020742 TaxID=3154897 RepID=UPI0033F178C2